MKAAVCTAYGPPRVLRIEERPAPVPGRREVLVRVRATAVTSSDVYLRGLRLPAAYRLAARLTLGWRRPRRAVLGMVLSGEVAGVGTDVTGLRVGEEVFGFDRRVFGAYAQYACWPGDALLVPKPAGVSHERAAAALYGGLLADHLLRRAAVEEGRQVLLYGASGAVGTAAVQLCREAGAIVTGVCGPNNLGLVRSLGAARVLDYTAGAVCGGPERYDAVIDAVGRARSASALRDVERVLAPGGVSVSIDDGTPRLRREALVRLGATLSEGRFEAVIDRVFALEDIAAAHAYVDEGHKRGNVVVTVP